MLLLHNLYLLLITNVIDIISESEIATLQLLNGSRVKAFDSILFILTVTAYGVGLLLPVCLYLVGHLRKRLSLKLKVFQYVLAMCLNVLFIGTLKYTINRPRPFVSHDMIEQLAHASSPSFPSGHTAFAFTAAVVISIMFRNAWLQSLLFVWALLVAYSRLALGVHYPTDVLGSVMLGTTAALMANYAFRKYRVKLLILLRQTRTWNPIRR